MSNYTGVGTYSVTIWYIQLTSSVLLSKAEEKIPPSSSIDPIRAMEGGVDGLVVSPTVHSWSSFKADPVNSRPGLLNIVPEGGIPLKLTDHFLLFPPTSLSLSLSLPISPAPVFQNMTHLFSLVSQSVARPDRDKEDSC